MRRFSAAAVVLFFLATNIIAQNADKVRPENKGPQLYNMSFDHWCKIRREWCLHEEGADPKDRIWGTANRGLSILGINGTEPESEIVAVKGPGKMAVKLHSEKILWAFAAGALYNGSFVRIVDWSGAEITWGVPFTARPKSMTGYYYYIPKPINYAKNPYKHLKGTMDEGQIEVILTDWNEPVHIISNDGSLVDTENDPHIIGRGYITIDKPTGGYVKFDMPIKYKNDKTPKYVVVIGTSSRYGGYYTGGNGSTLYLDEFEFKY